MGDEYEYGVVKGSLKLKQGRVSKPKKKSKKSKKKTSTDPVPEQTGPEKTQAELKYEETQKRRKLEQIERLAGKSYREQIKEFNDKLEREPEQHDMPRVGG
ncbi:hypothetical protein IWW50_000882 [Coemansia erecta]|nr:hypothetical protein GGF43_001954 [Coemansia sp. RSA 2618]KAJ2829392.1 hypothetical protein IWW50_000882 [Coemansia erecta]